MASRSNQGMCGSGNMDLNFKKFICLKIYTVIIVCNQFYTGQYTNVIKTIMEDLGKSYILQLDIVISYFHKWFCGS